MPHMNLDVFLVYVFYIAVGGAQPPIYNWLRHCHNYVGSVTGAMFCITSESGL